MLSQFLSRALLLSLAILLSYSGVWAVEAPPRLMLWVKAESLAADVADGERVGFWRDQSGQAHHLKSAGAARPTFKANSFGPERPGVVFRGDKTIEPMINEYLTVPINSEWRGITVFVIGELYNRGAWFNSAPGWNRAVWVMQQHSGWLRNRVDIRNAFPTPGVMQLATITAGIEETSAAYCAVYANGKLVQETREQGPEPYGIYFLNARIGSNGQTRGDAVFNGALAEVLVYQGRLNNDERMAVERYLQVKHGLAEAAEGDPQSPLGYTPPAPLALPETKAQPHQQGLVLWAKADAITGLEHGQPVTEVPNQAGEKETLRSIGDEPPTYLREGISGLPAIRFAGSGGNTPMLHKLQLPLKEGLWPEITVVVAGRNLAWRSFFDSGMSEKFSLTLGNGATITSSKLNILKPYPLHTAFPLASDDSKQAVIAVTLGMVPGKGHHYLASYANGWLQERVEDLAYKSGVLIKQPIVGASGRNSPFQGEISEVLIYEKALSEEELQQTFAYLEEKYLIERLPEAVAKQKLNSRSRWSVALPTIPHTANWAGNSFNAVETWVQSGLRDVAVRDDGTVAVACVWDERNKAIGLYKDGMALAKPFSGGSSTAIAWDGAYYYRAQRDWNRPPTVQVLRMTADLMEVPWPELKPQKWPS